MNAREVVFASGWTLSLVRPEPDAASCEHGLVERNGSCASCGLDALRVHLEIHDRVVQHGYRGGVWTD